MGDDSGQRTVPLGFSEVGQRVGMPERFALVQRLAEEGANQAVTAALTEIWKELEAHRDGATLVADVLESFGCYQMEVGGSGTRNVAPEQTPGSSLDAVPLWERCLSIRVDHLGVSHPDTLVVRYLLGAWYSNVGQHERAIRLLEDNLQSATGAAFEALQLSWLAISLRKAGRLEEARRCWDRVVESSGITRTNRARARANRGSLHATTGNIAAARDDYDRALEELEAELPDSANQLCQTARAYSRVLSDANDLMGAELAHQLQVVVCLRSGKAPEGRAHGRPQETAELMERTKAVWDRVTRAFSKVS